MADNILEKIIKKKVVYIEQLKKTVDLSNLKDLISMNNFYLDFKEKISTNINENKISIIAEIKKASPSAGIIINDYNPVEIANIYYKNNSTCLSVLTEEDFFLGKIDHIRQIKEKIKLPILCKDFFIDKFQIPLAKSYGADAILIILAAVSEKIAHEIYTLAEELNLNTNQSGFLAGAEGLGAFIGALIIATRQFTTPGRRLLFGSIIFEIFLIAFSHAPELIFAIPLLVLSGIGHSGFSASQSALMIAYSDPTMRSRTMGVLAVCIGTQPFGILLLGVIAEFYGAPIAVAISASLGTALLIWAGYKWPAIRRGSFYEPPNDLSHQKQDNNRNNDQ